MRALLFYCLLLSNTASAFVPQHARFALSRPTKDTVGTTLFAAEARNASDISKENVGEYRNTVPSSRTDGEKPTEVRPRKSFYPL